MQFLLFQLKKATKNAENRKLKYIQIFGFNVLKILMTKLNIANIFSDLLKMYSVFQELKIERF